MLFERRAVDRGRSDHGWLDSRHTFSFADYYDPEHMGFRGLRVINEDRVAAGHGFGPHGHRDMEIVSYVLEGALEHRDSMGTGSVIRPGELQRMSAGTGVVHGEQNPSATEPVHFLQIWIVPERRGLSPSYEQRSFGTEETAGRLRVVASRDGRDGSLTIHADASILLGVFDEGQSARLALAPGRHAWVHVVRGRARIAGRELGAGDALAVTDEPAVEVAGVAAGELLVFDLS